MDEFAGGARNNTLSIPLAENNQEVKPEARIYLGICMRQANNSGCNK